MPVASCEVILPANFSYLYPFIKTSTAMSLFRVILAILFPPLAVIDKGCGSVLIVFLLTLAGWIPGVIAALIILNKGN
jgi:uncharacterized membrane protein YqaE (UPF0057 family)